MYKLVVAWVCVVVASGNGKSPSWVSLGELGFRTTNTRSFSGRSCLTCRAADIRQPEQLKGPGERTLLNTQCTSKY